MSDDISIDPLMAGAKYTLICTRGVKIVVSLKIADF